MTDTPQWALNRAREWLDKESVKLAGYSCVLEDNLWVEADENTHASLAALLVEVATPKLGVAKMIREDVLAEVRRVVLDVYERDDDIPPHKRDELLSRLERL